MGHLFIFTRQYVTVDAIRAFTYEHNGQWIRVTVPVGECVIDGYEIDGYDHRLAIDSDTTPDDILLDEDMDQVARRVIQFSFLPCAGGATALRSAWAPAVGSCDFSRFASGLAGSVLWCRRNGKNANPSPDTKNGFLRELNSPGSRGC